MAFFDMKEQVDGYIREIGAHPSEEREKVIDTDPQKGLQQMADLLTFLPEDQRKGAVIGFVMSMLCD